MKMLWCHNKMDILQFDLKPMFCCAKSYKYYNCVTTCPITATFVFIMNLQCGQALEGQLISLYSTRHKLEQLKGWGPLTM